MELEKVLGLIENADDNYPLKIAYKKQHRYYYDFVTVVKTFKQILSIKQFNELVDKFQLAKSFNQQRYLQTVSEITILYYVLRYCNAEHNFIYEPKYNGGYNPECSFAYMDKTVNLEVKCPNLEKRIEIQNKNTLKIFPAERISQHKEIINELSDIIKPKIQDSAYSGVEEEKRLDNKLKDYLISSQKKFPVSDNSNFNILAISLDIVSDLDEWYSYVFGNNGAFTHNSFISEKYDNVDAILLTTPACGHVRWEMYGKINVWSLEETVNILLLNPDREHSKTGDYYIKYGMSMFGELTKEFLMFQQKLDEQAKEKWRDIDDRDNIRDMRYIDYKIVDLQIVTEFMNYLKNGHL